MNGFNDFMKSENAAFWGTLRGWWESLQDARGNRAQLRRARTAEDVLVSPAYQRTLVAGLRESGVKLDMYQQERLALGAGLLSHAKKLTDGPHMARRLGQLQNLDENIRDLRFRRLLEVTDRDELYIALMRLLRYMGGEVDPVSLVRGAFWWNETTKKEWAREYYVKSSNQ